MYVMDLTFLACSSEAFVSNQISNSELPTPNMFMKSMLKILYLVGFLLYLAVILLLTKLLSYCVNLGYPWVLFS